MLETFIFSKTHTLKDAVDTFLLAGRVEGRKKSTQVFYHFTVGKFFEWAGDIPLDLIDRHLVRKFITTLEQRELSLTTISNNIRALKTFFAFLIREEFISKNPTEHINKPRLPKQYPFILEDHTVQNLLKTPNQRKWEGQRNYVILLTCPAQAALRGRRISGEGPEDALVAIRTGMPRWDTCPSTTPKCGEFLFYIGFYTFPPVNHFSIIQKGTVFKIWLIPPYLARFRAKRL